MLIRGAEIAGTGPLDVRIEGDRITEITPALPRVDGELTLDADGGALLPGLHDHHIHLFALAAAEQSVRCGPPEVCNVDALARALEHANVRDEWIRGVGYHESVAGELDRTQLDAWLADRPLRIQHRSGALWLLNSAGVERLGLDRGADAHGIERDARGRATGRLYRLDDWLRERLEAKDPPNLDAVSRRLADRGVTGLTDATATNDTEALSALVAAVDSGALRQRIRVMGRPTLPEPHHPGIEHGGVKLLLDERELPDFEDFAAVIATAHRSDRSVAIHCVTRTELVLACAAFEAAGPRAGDRIEHAGVAPPDTLPALRKNGLSVVTQPHFLSERGDAYLADVEARDLPWLYRGRGFLEAGIPLGGGSDAPFGAPDPWASMQAAVERRSRGGAVLGPRERLSPEEALALFTTRPEAPGGPARCVEVGEIADLCLLDRPWAEARNDLAAARVVLTLRAGRVISQAET
ncbi:MAG: amidohydrolase family protein [Deltaproteobacteria bacterium]|nr:amidohydrolase family protein [Deltaproteobacteria bacterium]MBW2666226.1 amidohydrolase family protein [Deltaproteobacteria bacterium]